MKSYFAETSLFVPFLNRPDKHWSMTDCICFLVRHARGPTEALTTDHQFGQAGCKVLLK